jgi:hypothetical protein
MTGMACMTDANARDEIRAAIEWYDARGKCWLSVVTWIGIRALFGSWRELTDSVRRPFAGKKVER